MTGDFAKLHDVALKMGRLGSGEFMEELRGRLADTSMELVSEEFRVERDPYGRPWKKSGRAIGEGGATLRDSGRLRNSFNAQPVPGGFVVGTNVKYAAIHQYGGVIRAKTSRGLRFKVGAFRGKNRSEGRWVTKMSVTIPQRQIIPEGGLGLRWTLRFAEEASAALRETMGS